jgi:formylglycine-generating enzyme required for sulfatase activity
VEVPPNVVPTTNMVFIAPGKFMMGSPASEAARWNDEGPQRLVTISRGFWMGKYEVTQAEFLDVMGYNPSFHNGVQNTPEPGTDYGTDLSRPVEQLKWSDAVAYCQALTAREQSAGRLPAGFVYRLPTEAEWEYACRAGTTTPYHYGSALRSGMANFDGRREYPPCGDSTNSCENASGTFLDRTTPVGSYAPNGWGLHDMHGNVSEFCQDYIGLYPVGSVTDPQGPASGVERVVRGGVLTARADFCRSAFRDWAPPSWQHRAFGFRVVLGPTL